MGGKGANVMPTPTEFTVYVLALLAIVAVLAFFAGLALRDRREDEREIQAEKRGFDQGAATDDKTRKIGERAKRFGR